MSRNRRPAQAEPMVSALDRLADELRPALVSLTRARETAAVAAVFRANAARIEQAKIQDAARQPAALVGVVINRPHQQAVTR